MHTYVRRALQAALVSGGLLAAGAFVAHTLPGTELWLAAVALLLLVVAVRRHARAGRAPDHHHPGRLPFVPHQRGPSDTP